MIFAHHNNSASMPFPAAPVTTASNRSTTPAKCGYKECCWYLFAIVVFILFMTVLYRIYIGLVGTRPPQFQIDSVTVYPFNISSSHHITANWDLIFSFINPGCMPYKDVQVSVLHKDIIISSAPAMPKCPGKNRCEGLVMAHVAASSVQMEESAAEDVVSEWGKGAVKFNFKLNACVVSEWGGKYKQVIVECKKVNINFMSNANRTVGNLLSINSPAECGIHIY